MVALFNIVGALIAIASLLSPVAAHGDESDHALARRHLHAQHASRSLGSCADRLYARDRMEHRLKKRDAFIARHMQKRSLEKRQATTPKRPDPPAHDDNAKCVLSPEVTVGPYYVPGMLIREDIRAGEGEPGIPLLLDLEFVDVETCDPVPDAMVDAWHCNVTGKYSGFAGEGTLEESFNRGLQPTDEKGVMHMVTSFPGWYPGRAVHIHIASHVGGKTLENGTYVGGNVTHIGQVFFDEATIEKAHQFTTYKKNTFQRVLNDQDFIYKQQVTGYDGLAKAQWLSDDVEDGVYAFLTVGINLKASYDINFSFGGPNSPFPSGFPPFPPGGFPGNFTLPSGFTLPPGFQIPSGFPIPPGFPGAGAPPAAAPTAAPAAPAAP